MHFKQILFSIRENNLVLFATDRLLRPRGGGGGGRALVLEGGTILKQAPFWVVNFSLVRNIRLVKFYGTATAV